MFGLVRSDAVITLAPHDPAWAIAFARESALVTSALGDVLLALHHIGSTAIPGIVAKPVIDMLAAVSGVVQLDERQRLIEALGYEAMGEFGIPGRRYFRKTSSEGARTHQLHAFDAGSPELRRHLDFRDYLRAHPATAAEYAALKQRLARDCAADAGAYTEGKTSFVRDVQRRAQRWRQGG